MKKIFIISYGCCPEKQSELAIGWNFVKNLSKKNNLTVLTRQKNKDAISEFIKNSNDKYLKKIKWLFYDFNEPFLKLKKYIGTQLYFFMWQKFSYKLYKKHIIKQKFDFIHHLNYGIVWMHSPFYKLPGKFIWGPLGGGDTIPWSFLVKESYRAILREILYKILIWTSRNLSINNKLCKSNSEIILFRTKKIATRYLGLNGQDKSIILCETGFDIKEIKKAQNDYSHINAISIGRMDYWKGMIYAVKGFEKYISKGGRGQLTLIGNGKEFKNIQKYIVRKKIENFIQLKGRVDYSSYLNHVKLANVLIYPSFRDGGSFTVLESMAMGKAVICSNNSGPAEMVTKQAGFVINTINPNQYINDICDNLMKIEYDPLLAQKKANLLRERAVNYYTWEKHAADVSKIYDTCN